MTDQTTDTPVNQPPTHLERLKAFLGDLARPFAIIVTSASAAYAVCTIAYQGKDFSGGAIFITAVFAGVALLYGAKSYENVKQAQANADVAKSTGSAS